MPSYNEINAPFWKNSLHVLQLPDEMPSQREVTWLIEILNAANKLSSKGAVLIDADDMDNPTADLPDVHVEVDFKDVFTPLRVKLAGELQSQKMQLLSLKSKTTQ
ncbi:hypothetical protein V4F62_004331 [Vibrio parahaemolyticus]|uniref:hypothetical protein n=1 Tax=Vibrio parahaemolyticus TaxID=670 RepID=UPI001121D3D8|nr:hypothetical protein [Vibrio parahaemolyticus]